MVVFRVKRSIFRQNICIFVSCLSPNIHFSLKNGQKMTENKKKRLFREVLSKIDMGKVDEILRFPKSATRIGMIQGELRRAVNESSLGMIGDSRYFFGGCIYEPVSDSVLCDMIYEILVSLKFPDEDMTKVDLVIRVCRRCISSKVLNIDSSLVVFENGVFDTRSKKLCRFSPKFVQTSMVSYRFEPNNKIDLWKSFIYQVLPDKEFRNVFQEFVGSVFIDRSLIKLETMLILKGSGSNGKSVIFETLTGVVGRENVSNFGLKALISGNESKKNMASINGKRLNYCSEIQALEIGRDSDALKALISGEPVEARAMYKDNFTAYNIPLLMANANQLPYIKDWSYGMRRRIIILPFDVEIPKGKQRKGLARELSEEYPAIFNWFMAGHERFVSNGYKFTDSDKVEQIMDEYQSNSHPVINYMHQMGFKRSFGDYHYIEPNWVLAKRLYQGYRDWCFEHNIKYDTLQLFGKILSEAGYMKRRSGDGVLYGVFGSAVPFDSEREISEYSNL